TVRVWMAGSLPVTGAPVTGPVRTDSAAMATTSARRAAARIVRRDWDIVTTSICERLAGVRRQPPDDGPTASVPDGRCASRRNQALAPPDSGRSGAHAWLRGRGLVIRGAGWAYPIAQCEP